MTEFLRDFILQIDDFGIREINNFSFNKNIDHFWKDLIFF